VDRSSVLPFGADEDHSSEVSAFERPLRSRVAARVYFIACRTLAISMCNGPRAAGQPEARPLWARVGFGEPSLNKCAKRSVLVGPQLSPNCARQRPGKELTNVCVQTLESRQGAKPTGLVRGRNVKD
jgi:hypothetical protein